MKTARAVAALYISHEARLVLRGAIILPHSASHLTIVLNKDSRSF